MHQVLAEACRILSCGMRNLVPWSGIEPRIPTLGVWHLIHWSTSEVAHLQLWARSLGIREVWWSSPPLVTFSCTSLPDTAAPVLFCLLRGFLSLDGTFFHLINSTYVLVDWLAYPTISWGVLSQTSSSAWTFGFYFITQEGIWSSLGTAGSAGHRVSAQDPIWETQGSLPRGNPTIAPLRASASRGSWPVCGTMDINAQDYSHSFKQIISYPALMCKAICHPLGIQNKMMASAFKKQVVLICGI